MSLIIRLCRTQVIREEEVMVVIIHLLEDMDNHLLEGLDRNPRLDMEEEE